MAREIRSPRRVQSTAVRWLVPALLTCGIAYAQDPNVCDLPGEAPDIVIHDLFETRRLGNVDGITAFAAGTDTCNIGSCWIEVAVNTNQHPVLAQGMFRLKGGKFEQIGQSWVAHRFVALSQPGCGPTCISAPTTHLGRGCMTNDLAVYGAGHFQLAPRFEINPVTGDFPFPGTDQNVAGDAVYKRLQVHDTDLAPSLNPGAQYFFEGLYVAEKDAASGNQNNNASYRPIDVIDSAGELDIALTGQTRVGQPAIVAWRDVDPSVTLSAVDVPGDGRFWVGSRATPLGYGMWHYEYAVQNLTSHRAARRFEVEIPPAATVNNVGFHDVDYHSGEPFDGTDWSPGVGAAAVSWETSSFGDDPDANALRWGTLYNFRFDADVPPVQAAVALELFRPGNPQSATIAAVVPGRCDANGSCDPDETPCSCAADCGAPAPFELTCNDGAGDDCDGLDDCADPDCCADAACAGLDGDGDGVASCDDCDDSDGTAWAIPGEVTAVNFPGKTTLEWSAPALSGGASLTYDVLRTVDATDFLGAATRLPAGDGTSIEDATVPDANVVFFYQARAASLCAFGCGSLGTRSDGSPRTALGCP